MSLKAREIIYSGQLAGKRLLGELHLTEKDLEALVADYHALPHRERDEYPLARAIALVFCGVYGYRSGNFWDHAARRFPELGDLNRHKRWTDAFTNTVSRRGLEPFADFPSSALLYVSRILAQGGVPDGCLSDFFALVRLAITRPEWAALAPADLIAEWQAREFRFLPSCDLPVQRFLVFGGDVARDFLQRAIDMAIMTQQTTVVPDAAEVGLPARVVARFAAWWVAIGDPVNARLVARLVPPTIRYDPWQPDGLTLDLPAQPTTGPNGLWTITAENATAPVSTRVRPEPGGGARQYLLDTPAARYAIAYDTGAGEPAHWTFPGMADARPLLAFDGASGKLLRTIDALPARSLAIVMPKDYTDVLDQTGASLVHEKFPLLVGGWNGFRGVAADITSARTICFTGSGVPTIGPLRVRSDSAQHTRPTIDITLHAIPGVVAGQDALPVLPAMPILRIPRTSSTEDDLWTVQIASAQRAADDITSPGDRNTHQEAESTAGIHLSHAVRGLVTTDENGEIVVPLDQPALLPPGAIGPLTITVRGPLGRDARFAFVLIPGLAIAGMGRPVVQPTHGVPEATLHVSATHPLHLEARSPGVKVAHAQPQTSPRTQHVVQATVRTVALALFPSGPSEPLTLTLTLPWPRWAVQGIGDRAALQWADKPIAIARDELVGAPAAALRLDGLVAAHDGAREVTGRVVLIIAGQDVEGEVRGASAWLPLDRFADTINASPTAALNATLDLWDLAGRHILVTHPVITITRALSVSGLALSDVVAPSPGGEEARSVTVTWDEHYPLDHRYVRFWPLAEPWASPASFPVPTDAGGQLTILAPVAELPAGPYRVEMIVQDVWAMDNTTAISPPVPPRGVDGPVRDVILGDAGERSARVDHLPNDAIGVLTRFLITNDATHLRRLSDLLATDSVEPALRVLLVLLTRERIGAIDDPTLRIARDALREAITIHCGCGAALVAVLAAGTDGAAFAHLVAALGLALAPPRAIASLLAPLDDVDRAAIETAWPLALSGEVSTWQCLAGRYPRAVAVLGTAGLSTLFEPSTGDQPIHPRQWQTRESRDGIVAHFDVAHFRQTGQGSFYWNHTRAAATLSRFSAHFTAPVRALDGDYVIAAMLEWLIALKHDATAARSAWMHAWIEEEYDHCIAALAALEHASLTPGQQIAVQLAAARRVPQEWLGGADDTQWLLMFPFVAAVTAMMQRLIARRADARGAVAFTDDYWRDSGRIAALVAPRLVQYDVCVFDLLLLPEANRIASDT